MSANMQGDEDEITGINVTPLVDVMLVLLTVFMVTTTYIVHRSLGVKLPRADTATEQATTKNLGFVINPAGDIFVDGQKISIEDLPAFIKTFKSQLGPGTTPQALISADEATTHGHVVRLIDTIRKQGITDFAINVETPR